MPHFIVEYSANLDGVVDLAGFCDAVRDAAAQTGVFPLGGIRVRTHRCEVYTIADGNPDYGFIHVELRMATGRGMETRERAGQAVFEAMKRFLGGIFDVQPLALSFEINEIEPALSFKKNSIHDRIAGTDKG